MTNGTKLLSIFAFGVCALLFAGCAQYATVSEIHPTFRAGQPPTASSDPADLDIADAGLRARREPSRALGEYLSAAQIAAQRLARNPHDTEALDAYNFAVSRVFGIIRSEKLDPWTHPLTVPAAGGEFQLTHQAVTRKIYDPALYDFTPSDQFDVHGTYVTERTVKPGLGAPLVAVGRELRADATQEFALDRVFYGVTAIARFEGRRVVISFEDPLAEETTSFEGHSYPLAADFTVPVAVMLARENPKKLEIARVLNPEKYAKTAHIVRLQPYDPNKTVVLVVHGLMDSPATWTPLIIKLRSYAEIRKNYQFWFYSYPSGYPYPYSAAIMREQLDAIEKRFPLRKPMVIIGHSMGSMIGRLMITDSGGRIWENYFGKPPEKVSIPAPYKRMLEEAFIFRHRPEVGRVIFISGPHRGSNLASNWIGRIASSLIHAPRTLLKLGNDVRGIVTVNAGTLRLNHIPNSVDTLSPTNQFVKLVNTIPLTPGIPFHSIMGDRGRGDTPNSSDGVVPYWSSHLDGAQSELIVPSGHSAHQNPKAIAEVRRILLLNAGITAKE
jgi:pimeloyl-ACP methyl ester carboxylesterase